jgi:hypothetical protein
MTDWLIYIAVALIILLSCGNGCVTKKYYEVHPISEKIVVVPLDGKCPCKQPTTKPMIDRASPPQITSQGDSE